MANLDWDVRLVLDNRDLRKEEIYMDPFQRGTMPKSMQKNSSQEEEQARRSTRKAVEKKNAEESLVQTDL